MAGKKTSRDPHGLRDDVPSAPREGRRGAGGETPPTRQAASPRVVAKPIIGISMDFIPAGGFSGCVHNALSVQYAKAVSAAGGVPLHIPTIPDMYPEYLSRIDGLIVPGGGVGKPESWYAPEGGACPYPASDRLQSDTRLLKLAIEQNLPLLGICEGMQMLAGMLGCKLTANVNKAPGTPYNHWDATARHERGHGIHITPGSKLAEALGVRELRVNSHHREAVLQVAGNVAEVAKANDGVIEAIELTDHPFAIGVQWHPEYFHEEHSPDLGLFKALVAAAKNRMT